MTSRAKDLLMGKSSSKFLWLALAAVAVSFFPYFANAFFNEPSMDDYRYAVNYLSNDFWYLQGHMYKYWCGRYAATVLLYLGPLSFHSFVAYKLAAVLLFFAVIWSVYFAVWPQLGFLSPLRRHLAILMGTAIWLSCFPSMSQGFYWFSGAYTYMPAIVLMNVLLGLLFRLRRFRIDDPRWDSRATWIETLFVLGGVVIVAVTMGLNEVIAIYALGLLFVVNVAVWLRRGRPDWSLVAVSVAALVFALVSYFAPGNAVRSAGYDKARDVALTLWKSPAYLVWFSQYFLSLPLIVALIASITPLVRRTHRFPQWSHGAVARWTVLGLIVIFTLATFTLGVWATGVRPARRALNVLHYYEFGLLALVWCQWVLAYPDFWSRLRARLPVADSALLVVAAMTLFLSGNTREAWVDLLYRGPAYQKEMAERYARIAAGGDVMVDPIAVKPKTLFFEDITEVPTTWQSEYMAKYFGVSSVRLSGKDPNHPLRE
jgi:hypothetical protein